MVWNLLGEFTVTPESLTTPLVDASLGYFRFTFLSITNSMLLVAQSGADGTFHDGFQINPSGVMQSFEIPSPAFWEERSLVLKLIPNPRLLGSPKPLQVRIEVSDVPFALPGLSIGGDAGECEVDLSPVLTGQDEIKTLIQAIDLSESGNTGNVDLTPVLTAVSGNSTKLNNLAASVQTLGEDVSVIDTMLGGHISTAATRLLSLLTNDEEQEGLLDQISDAVSANTGKLDAIKAKTDTITAVDLSSLTTKVDGNTTKLDAIKTKVDSLSNADLSSLTSKVDALTALLTVPAADSTFVLESTPYTVSYSGLASGVVAPTYTTLNDGSASTGFRSASSSSEWLQATFPTELSIRGVQIASGNIGGNILALVNGCAIQYSLDGNTWATVVNVSGLDAVSNSKVLFAFARTTAKYWRLWRAATMATSEFRFYS